MFEIRGRESPDFSAFAEPAQQKIPANHVCRDFISGNRFGTVGLLRGIVRGSLRLTFLHSFLIPSLSSFFSFSFSFSFSFLPSSSFCLPSLSSLPPPLGGENEIRTRGTGCPVRRFSKPVVSATHPSLRAHSRTFPPERVCKYRMFLGKYKKMRPKIPIFA